MAHCRFEAGVKRPGGTLCTQERRKLNCHTRENRVEPHLRASAEQHSVVVEMSKWQVRNTALVGLLCMTMALQQLWEKTADEDTVFSSNIRST